MANKPVMGYEAVAVEARHGETENVVLRVDIPRNLKDDLVMYADSNDKTIKQTVIEALKNYLN